MSEILFRPMQPDEINFVRKPLIRVLKQAPTSLIDRHYAEAAKKTAQALLERSVVVVAEYAKRPGQLFGFVVYETQHEHPLLHCLYIKRDFQDVVPRLTTDLISLARAGKPGPMHYTMRFPAARQIPEAIFSPRLVNDNL